MVTEIFELLIIHNFPSVCNVPISEESLHFDEVNSTTLLGLDLFASNE